MTIFPWFDILVFLGRLVVFLNKNHSRQFNKYRKIVLCVRNCIMYCAKCISFVIVRASEEYAMIHAIEKKVVCIRRECAGLLQQYVAPSLQCGFDSNSHRRVGNTQIVEK